MAAARSWNLNGRPPRPGPVHASVPSWEKAFCSSVGCVPWGKICATKAWLPGYKNIVEWDDSGAREAFENAKARYWAKINNFACNIPIPDPDMFIDEVDYNPVIDTELVMDLYENPPPPSSESDNSEDLRHLPVIPTGWGDEEIDTTEQHSKWNLLLETPLPPTALANEGNHLPANGNCGNVYNESHNLGGEVGPDASWKGPRYNNSWQKQTSNGSTSQHWDNWNNAEMRSNGRSKYGFDSRITKPRYQADNFQHNSGMADWRNDQCRRNFRDRNGFGWRNSKPRYQAFNSQRNAYMPDRTQEKTTHAVKPVMEWQQKIQASCGQMNSQRSAEGILRCNNPVT